jgi:hypothetical protein
MTAKNDITGDEIRTKPSTAYADNWERIFGNKEKTKEEPKEETPTTNKRE